MWTHERRVAVGSAKGLHARPVALLVAYLRRVPPGTRFGLAGYRGPAQTWSVENFGEAHKASVFRVARWSGIMRSRKVEAISEGPA